MRAKIIYSRPQWWHEQELGSEVNCTIIPPDHPIAIASMNGFSAEDLFFVPDKEKFSSAEKPSGRWIPKCDVFPIVEAPSMIMIRNKPCSRTALYHRKNVHLIELLSGGRVRITKGMDKSIVIEEADPSLMLFDFIEEDIPFAMTAVPENSKITSLTILHDPGDDKLALNEDELEYLQLLLEWERRCAIEQRDRQPKSLFELNQRGIDLQTSIIKKLGSI